MRKGKGFAGMNEVRLFRSQIENLPRRDFLIPNDIPVGGVWIRYETIPEDWPEGPCVNVFMGERLRDGVRWFTVVPLYGPERNKQ